MYKFIKQAVSKHYHILFTSQVVIKTFRSSPSLVQIQLISFVRMNQMMNNDMPPLHDHRVKKEDWEGHGVQDSIRTPSHDQRHNRWDTTTSVSAIGDLVSTPNDSGVKNDARKPRPTPSPPKTAFMCFSITKVR